MRAFEVKAGTEVNAIQDGKEWNGRNVHTHTTTEDHLFFLEEMVVDPTGISKTACVSGCVTIGSHWAKCGYYGFRRNGWAILIPAASVTVH